MTRSYQIVDQYALYFLTLQIVGWVDIFTRERYREIVIENLKFCQKNKGLQIYAYVVMSNHIHLIVSVDNGNLSNIIRDFKGYTSKRIIHSIKTDIESRRGWLLRLFRYYGELNNRNIRYQFWTNCNHAEELVSQKFIEQKTEYIHMNPVKAGIVSKPENYVYSSAAYYYEGDGLIECTSINDI
jgi:REP element-mobilizing transposase RayT